MSIPGVKGTNPPNYGGNVNQTDKVKFAENNLTLKDDNRQYRQDTLHTIGSIEGKLKFGSVQTKIAENALWTEMDKVLDKIASGKATPEDYTSVVKIVDLAEKISQREKKRGSSTDVLKEAFQNRLDFLPEAEKKGDNFSQIDLGHLKLDMQDKLAETFGNVKIPVNTKVSGINSDLFPNLRDQSSLKIDKFFECLSPD